jgi:hypothetical protein
MDRTVEDIFLDHIAALKVEAANTAEKSERVSAADGRQKAACFPYTLVSETKGDGISGPRMGSHVWPEENSLFILYITEEMLDTLKGIIRTMRKNHPSNGIAAFFVPEAKELV